MDPNKTLIRRLYSEGLNRQDAVKAAGFYALDAKNHGRQVGRAGMQRVFEALFSIFPDFHYEILGDMATHPHPAPAEGGAGSKHVRCLDATPQRDASAGDSRAYVRLRGRIPNKDIGAPAPRSGAPPPEGESPQHGRGGRKVVRVVCKVMMTGTHLGQPAMPEIFHGMLGGVAPTRRRVEVLQYHDFLVRGGEIAEHAAVRDDLGMLLQLGLVRTPEAGRAS